MIHYTFTQSCKWFSMRAKSLPCLVQAYGSIRRPRALTCLGTCFPSVAPHSRPLSLKVGQTLVGDKWTYRLVKQLVKGTHRSRVFKAEVLPGKETQVSSKWALIKSGSPEDERTFESLHREYMVYRKPRIASSTYIRSMIDIVGDHHKRDSDKPLCLVLEWLDCTLADLPYEGFRNKYALLGDIVRAGLSSLAAFHEEDLVHTDCKPANILLSNVDTENPIIKLGDLGSVRPHGYTGIAQPIALRAPEVYEGRGCTHVSDVWSFAVSLFDWMKPGVFGRSGIIEGLPEDSWCIAKLILLFPGWRPQPSDDAGIKDSFELAELLLDSPVEDNPEEKIVLVSSLEDEMRDSCFPAEVKALFRYLLVSDRMQRPSAQEALASDQFRALRQLGCGGMLKKT